MSEEDLNIKYICEITGLEKNDKLVPIILEVMWESYNSGLAQAEIDNTMGIIEENKELKKQLKELEEQSSNAINKQVARGIVLINQQKEFINYLKSMLENEKDNFSVARVKDVLSKYKEIIGVDNE